LQPGQEPASGPPWLLLVGQGASGKTGTLSQTSAGSLPSEQKLL